jgi:hypothetical protein
METLPTIITLLIALSVASERLVEIIKGLIPWLNQQKTDPKIEGRRTAVLQGLAVAAGILTTILAKPAIGGAVSGPWASLPGLLALGLLASGGSGLWNSILTYFLKIKDVAKLDVMKRFADGANSSQPGSSPSR